jgi:hypothetical protein
LPAAVSDWLQPDAAQSLLTEKIDGFRPERGDFRNWCIAVVKNDAISRLRQMNKDALGHARTGKAGDECSEEESWMGDHDPSVESSELMTEQLDRIRSTSIDVILSSRGESITTPSCWFTSVGFSASACARRSIRGSTQGWAIVPNWSSTVFHGGLPKASDDSSRGGR